MTPKKTKFHDYTSIEEALEILENKKISKATSVEFNICLIKSEDKCRTDLLWERLALPIHNMRGRVIAYAGRKLETLEYEFAKSMKSKYTSDELANEKINKWIKSKWINEPYEKQKNLFNIHRAYESIINENYCILVEGYWDVISLHEKGIYNTVASCGTSLSKYQIFLIKSLCDHCLIMYDPDDAGIKAATTAQENFENYNFASTIINLPDNVDPDDYFKNKKASSVKQTLDQINNNQKRTVTLL